jgi:hypothetical protein
MFDARGCDPQIILENRLTLGFQLLPKPRIHGGRCQGNVQHATASNEPLNLRQIVEGFREFSAPYRSSPTTGTGRRNSVLA